MYLRPLVFSCQTTAQHEQPIFKAYSNPQEPVSVTSSEEYIRLSQESTRKLTEMADMVLQMETERDDIRTEFDNYKSEVLFGGVLTQKKPKKTSRYTKIGKLALVFFWFFLVFF